MSAVHSQGHTVAQTVISADIEGLTDRKTSILSVMRKEQHCHCFCLQETHRSKDQAWPGIPGMSLVAECLHKHGTTRISSLYPQTFRICVRNLFWIPSRAHSITLYVWL